MAGRAIYEPLIIVTASLFPFPLPAVSAILARMRATHGPRSHADAHVTHRDLMSMFGLSFPLLRLARQVPRWYVTVTNRSSEHSPWAHVES